MKAILILLLFAATASFAAFAAPKTDEPSLLTDEWLLIEFLLPPEVEKPRPPGNPCAGLSEDEPTPLCPCPPTPPNTPCF